MDELPRTVLAADLRGAIGLDIARDGKVYWTEIGNQALESEGRLRMYDPESKATSTLLTLQTRADHESSNDGVHGMALDPDFEHQPPPLHLLLAAHGPRAATAVWSSATT